MVGTSAHSSGCPRLSKTKALESPSASLSSKWIKSTLVWVSLSIKQVTFVLASQVSLLQVTKHTPQLCALVHMQSTDFTKGLRPNPSSVAAKEQNLALTIVATSISPQLLY